MNWLEIIGLVFGSNVLMFLITMRATRKKANADAKDSEAKAKGSELENDEKAAQIVMSYIVEPLKKEINALRKDVRMLKKAVEAINDCPHNYDCPVRHKLQNNQDGDRTED